MSLWKKTYFGAGEWRHPSSSSVSEVCYSTSKTFSSTGAITSSWLLLSSGTDRCIASPTPCPTLSEMVPIHAVFNVRTSSLVPV